MTLKHRQGALDSALAQFADGGYARECNVRSHDDIAPLHQCRLWIGLALDHIGSGAGELVPIPGAHSGIRIHYSTAHDLLPSKGGTCARCGKFIGPIPEAMSKHDEQTLALIRNGLR